MTYISMRDDVRPATQAERNYVKSLAPYANDWTIETDGLSLYWSEPQSMARYSTQYPAKRRDGE